jgi:hypothetical protein
MQLTAGLRFNEPLPLGFHNSISLGYVRNSLSSEFLPPGMAAWKTEHGVEFNVLLHYGPFLVQPVLQYYANVGGIGGHALVAGLRTKDRFLRSGSSSEAFSDCWVVNNAILTVRRSLPVYPRPHHLPRPQAYTSSNFITYTEVFPMRGSGPSPRRSQFQRRSPRSSRQHLLRPRLRRVRVSARRRAVRFRSVKVYDVRRVVYAGRYFRQSGISIE